LLFLRGGVFQKINKSVKQSKVSKNEFNPLERFSDLLKKAEATMKTGQLYP
jgi:hypothetical protein